MPAGQEVPARQEAPGRLRLAWAAVCGPVAGIVRLPAGLAIWLGSFLLLAAVLLIRNAYLFSARIYESQDFAANTIAVLQARHLRLLTGIYSKKGFYHPGPALLYVMAAGESALHSLLHVVPTPWNGQLTVILLLNAALLAASVAVFARQAGSARVALAFLAVLLGFAAVHPLAVNSGWMPYVYFAPALLLLVSGASVGSGQTADLPLLALSAGLCINGQAEFLLFAPVVVAAALGGLVVAHHSDLRGIVRGRGWHWAGALLTAVLLLFPIALNTALHFPGQFGNYLDYTKTVPVHHSLGVSVRYALRFWWPGTPTASAAQGGLWVMAVLGVAALVLALRCPLPGMRRFLCWSLTVAALTTAAFVYYADASITDQDITNQAYLGYFYWAVPLLVAAVAAAGVVVHAGQRRAALISLAALAAAAGVTATVVPQQRDDPNDPPARYLGVPQLPRTVSLLEGIARGRPIVVTITGHNWKDAVGVIAYADRTGLRSCVTGLYRQSWDGALLFRTQSVCTTREKQAGVSFVFNPRTGWTPRDGPVIAALPFTLITQLPPPHPESRT
ncbi:MAG TPA: hypothetical protein VGS19_03020 [Streptosporangiaceae bacterium]|nr:hypothetical protein [Streptosporangiaceae bacterium]